MLINAYRATYRGKNERLALCCDTLGRPWLIGKLMTGSDRGCAAAWAMRQSRCSDHAVHDSRKRNRRQTGSHPICPLTFP